MYFVLSSAPRPCHLKRKLYDNRRYTSSLSRSSRKFISQFQNAGKRTKVDAYNSDHASLSSSWTYVVSYLLSSLFPVQIHLISQIKRRYKCLPVLHTKPAIQYAIHDHSRQLLFRSKSDEESQKTL